MQIKDLHYQTKQSITSKDLADLKDLVLSSYDFTAKLIKLRMDNRLSTIPNELQVLIAQDLLVGLMEILESTQQFDRFAVTLSLTATNTDSLVKNYDLDRIAKLLSKLATDIEKQKWIDSFIC